MDRFKRFQRHAAVVITLAGAPLLPVIAARAAPPANDYPTFARVQYVEECVSRSGRGDAMASLYQCACAIDRIADHLTYDQFVEASTFSHYATLPGEAGGIFRDPDRAKQQTKLFKSLEADAWRACGIKAAGT